MSVFVLTHSENAYLRRCSGVYLDFRLEAEKVSMARNSFKRIVGLVFRTSYQLAIAALRFVHSGILLLAEGAKTKSGEDELNSSIRGGILNYRTGKLDDGTDPVGWYEKD